jgi:hypothetical protein
MDTFERTGSEAARLDIPRDNSHTRQDTVQDHVVPVGKRGHCHANMSHAAMIALMPRVTCCPHSLSAG